VVDKLGRPRDGRLAVDNVKLGRPMDVSTEGRLRLKLKDGSVGTAKLVLRSIEGRLRLSETDGNVGRAMLERLGRLTDVSIVGKLKLREGSDRLKLGSESDGRLKVVEISGRLIEVSMLGRLTDRLGRLMEMLDKLLGITCVGRSVKLGRMDGNEMDGVLRPILIVLKLIVGTAMLVERAGRLTLGSDRLGRLVAGRDRLILLKVGDGSASGVVENVGKAVSWSVTGVRYAIETYICQDS
jgi:hypothetical protein